MLLDYALPSKNGRILNTGRAIYQSHQCHNRLLSVVTKSTNESTEKPDLLKHFLCNHFRCEIYFVLITITFNVLWFTLTNITLAVTVICQFVTAVCMWVYSCLGETVNVVILSHYGPTLKGLHRGPRKSLCLRNNQYCVGWDVKVCSLTYLPTKI